MKKTIIRNEKELKCMLVELFEGNAAGTNWHAVHDNYLPIVQFAMKQEKMKSTILKGDEKNNPPGQRCLGAGGALFHLNCID